MHPFTDQLYAAALQAVARLADVVVHGDTHTFQPFKHYGIKTALLHDTDY